MAVGLSGSEGRAAGPAAAPLQTEAYVDLLQGFLGVAWFNLAPFLPGCPRAGLPNVLALPVPRWLGFQFSYS